MPDENDVAGTSASTRVEQLQLVHIARKYCMPLPLVRDAKKAFDHYCACGSSARKKSSQVTHCHTVASHDAASRSSSVPASTRKSFITDDDNNIDHEGCHGLLSIPVVAALLHDMNAPMSLSRVHDLVRRMRTTPHELVQLRQDETAVHKTGVMTAVVSSSSPTVTGRAEQRAIDDTAMNTTPALDVVDEVGKRVSPQVGMGLDFEAFVQLLCMRWPEEDSRIDSQAAEMEKDVAVMLHVLDHDGDGVLSERDIRKYVHELLSTEKGQHQLDVGPGAAGDGEEEANGAVGYDVEVNKLATMHPVELRIALQECDMDGDGYVTLPDLMALLRS